MSRETKFRGRTAKGWLCGNLIRGFCIKSILTEEEVASTPIDLLGNLIVINEVDENTIGQYIGLEDVHGEEIYEGDLLRNIDGSLTMIVAYNARQAAFGLVTTQMWKDRKYPFAWRFFKDNPAFMLEKFGNIHDNPEMLEE